MIGLPTDLKGNLSEIETGYFKIYKNPYERTFPEVEINGLMNVSLQKYGFWFFLSKWENKPQRQAAQWD